MDPSERRDFEDANLQVRKALARLTLVARAGVRQLDGVRLEIERAAELVRVPPNRISFVWALRLIRDEWRWASIASGPGSIPKKLRRMREEVACSVLPPRRADRSYPRAVKIKMSNYARKRPAARPSK